VVSWTGIFSLSVGLACGWAGEWVGVEQDGHSTRAKNRPWLPGQGRLADKREGKMNKKDNNTHHVTMLFTCALANHYQHPGAPCSFSKQPKQSYWLSPLRQNK